jgi:hypothetical protein
MLYDVCCVWQLQLANLLSYLPCSRIFDFLERVVGRWQGRGSATAAVSKNLLGELQEYLLGFPALGFFTFLGSLSLKF